MKKIIALFLVWMSFSCYAATASDVCKDTDSPSCKEAIHKFVNEHMDAYYAGMKYLKEQKRAIENMQEYVNGYELLLKDYSADPGSIYNLENNKSSLSLYNILNREKLQDQINKSILSAYLQLIKSDLHSYLAIFYYENRISNLENEVDYLKSKLESMEEVIYKKNNSKVMK